MTSKNITSCSLKKHDRVDGGAAALGIALPRLLPHEAEIERGFEMAIEVVLGNKSLQ